MTDIAVPVVSRKRRVAFYFLVGLNSIFLVATNFFIFSPALSSIPYGLWPVIGWFNPEPLGIHQLHNIMSGASFWAFLAGVILQLHKPERKVAGMQMVLLMISISAVLLLSLAPWPLSLIDVLPFFLFIVVIAILHPRRQELLRFGRPGNSELLILAGLAAIPLLFYAGNQISLQLTAGDEHAQFQHYISIANSALEILMLGILSSFRTPGWRIPAWIAGLIAIFFGLTSIVYPTQSSSLGLLWGSLAVLWGLAFIGVAEWRRTKERET